jgi:hypothetical protein
MKRAARRNKIDPWEHALSCPLPLSISYELLQTLRLDVVKYLNWVTHDLVMEDEQKALREIQRVADRLTRITSMIPDAAARHMQEYKKRIEIQRLATEGSVDRSLMARVEAARSDDSIPDDEADLSPEDIPFWNTATPASAPTIRKRICSKRP